jgi:hypothetical protein
VTTGRLSKCRQGGSAGSITSACDANRHNSCCKPFHRQLRRERDAPVLARPASGISEAEPRVDAVVSMVRPVGHWSSSELPGWLSREPATDGGNVSTGSRQAMGGVSN